MRVSDDERCVVRVPNDYDDSNNRMINNNNNDKKKKNDNYKRRRIFMNAVFARFPRWAGDRQRPSKRKREQKKKNNNNTKTSFARVPQRRQLSYLFFFVVKK